MRKWLLATALLVAACPGAALPESEDIATTDDRVRFVVANAVYVLLHELGHGLIHEFELPVLGEEEDAADTLASILLLNAENLDPHLRALGLQVLLSAGESQKLIWETGLEESQIEAYYWARHSISIRRYHRIVCLAYGSDTELFAEIPELVGMPEYRSDSCEDEFALAHRSVATVGGYLRDGESIGLRHEVDVPVRWRDTDDDVGRQIAEVIQSRDIVKRVLQGVEAMAALPEDMDVSFEDCEVPGAYWDPDDDTLYFCYQLLSALYRLAEGQKLPNLLRDRDIPVAGETQ